MSQAESQCLELVRQRCREAVNEVQELEDWGARMRSRTSRHFALQGSTPAGWHVLLPNGDFGFLDVKMAQTADEHAILVQEARDYMREMKVRACLFTLERELEGGQQALFLQFEAVTRGGQRDRSVKLHPIVTAGEGRSVDTQQAIEPTFETDRELLRFGLFPDLIPDPPSPFRLA